MQDLKTALQKVEDELRRVKEEAQLIREATEAEKNATRQLGAEETEARLSEEIPRYVGTTAASHGLVPLMLQEFLPIQR